MTEEKYAVLNAEFEKLKDALLISLVAMRDKAVGTLGDEQREKVIDTFDKERSEKLRQELGMMTSDQTMRTA